MATTIGDPSGQGPPPTGFHFYALDPLSAVARLVSSASVMLDWNHDHASSFTISIQLILRH